jgi:hypothetical protein
MLILVFAQLHVLEALFYSSLVIVTLIARITKKSTNNHETKKTKQTAGFVSMLGGDII